MSEPLFTNVDCLGVQVPDLDEALSFYRDKLGHELLWRSETSAGLGFGNGGKMPELVLHTDAWSIAAAIKVESVSEAIERFVAAGGSVVEPSSDGEETYSVWIDPTSSSGVDLEWTTGRHAFIEIVDMGRWR